MNFWRTSFWALIATIARLLSQFVVAKCVAVFAGVAAFGIIGQFQSFASLIQLGAGGVITGGVTKYSAEYHQRPDLLSNLIVTAIKFGFCASCFVGIWIAIFSKPLSHYIFQSADYWGILVIFGMTLFGYILNQVFLSVFNGLNQMVKYASIAIIGAVLSVLLIGIFCYFYAIKGALLGLILSQLALFGASLFFVKNIPVLKSILAVKIDRNLLKLLFIFSLMNVVAAIALPSAQIFLRSYVAYHSSWVDVGYWQAILRISDAYLLIITTVISVYAVPKYSRILIKQELKEEVHFIFIRIMPIVSFLAWLVYLFKHLIILILFSPKFLVMENFFAFQLIGDVFKIASWIFANVLLAKTQVRAYILFECLFVIFYVVLSLFFFKIYGVFGLTVAFCVNYIFYFFAVLYWFYSYLRA